MDFETVETEFDIAAELSAASNARALHVLNCIAQDAPIPDRWAGMSDADIVVYCRDGYQYGNSDVRVSR